MTTVGDPAAEQVLVRGFLPGPGTGLLHYAQQGFGPTILLLHQVPRSWAEFRPVLRLLSATHDTLAVDLPGFGESDPLPGEPSIEGWAAAVASVLDWQGLTEVLVVGHHTGGVVAVELAAARPDLVAGLVLSSTPYVDPVFRGRPAHGVDDVDAPRDGSHLAALWQGRQGFYPPDRPDLLEAFVLDAMRAGPLASVGHAVVRAYHMEDRLPLVTAPISIIEAPEDPYAAASLPGLRAALPDAPVHRIEGGMVPLPDQLPEAFAAAVLAAATRSERR